MYAGLQKTSLVDYPGRLAAAVFLPGCNMRCPYCYNGELACASAQSGPEGEAYVPIEKIHQHIEKRSGVLNGCVISGGEALLSPALPDLITRAKNAGLSVKLDTNGLMPDALENLLKDSTLCPDMIALDVKTSIARYGSLVQGSPQVKREARENIQKTLRLLQKKDEFFHDIMIEYRTVLVPPLIKEADITDIAQYLPRDADWFFAPFTPINCLNARWNDITPYTKAEMEALINTAKTFVPKSCLR